jgi:uncharacterized tellurite resistance protein B-like protein
MSIAWSTEEKLCITKVLLDIMNADGRIDDGEIQYMEQIRLLVGISDLDLDTAHNTSVSYSMSILRSMSDSKKIALGIMMAEMVKADGNSDAREIFVFESVYSMIGIPNLT